MSLLARFANDREGSVLPIFALSLIPLIGLMGASIDYSRAAANRTAMQAAIDSVAIMLAREATKLTSDQLNAKANEYFNALYAGAGTSGITLTPTFNIVDGAYKVNVAVSGTIKTRFMNLLGVSNMNIATDSEVVWGTRKLELALALDNTGSMAQSGKMVELKKAAKDLLDTLKKSAITPDVVKVAIVPFATHVNVGTGNVNASWLDWSDWDSKHGKCVNNGGQVKACGNNTTWVPDDHSTWNGCVWDRDNPHDVQDSVPDNKSRKFQPSQAANCPVSMMTLTNDWTALNAKVETMTPTGNTNVTIGLSWAWHLLTPGEPITSAGAPDKKLDKVIILLTDGANTQNRFGDNTGNNIDVRTKQACDNVKAAGIKLYTVRVIDGNATLLQSCATEPGMYYDVQNAAGLMAVFNKIAENLASLRIAK